MVFLCSIFKGVCFSIVTFSCKRYIKEINWYSQLQAAQKGKKKKKTVRKQATPQTSVRGRREKERRLFCPVTEYGRDAVTAVLNSEIAISRCNFPLPPARVLTPNHVSLPNSGPS